LLSVDRSLYNTAREGSICGVGGGIRTRPLLGKYDKDRHLKKTKARTVHQRYICDEKIEPKEYYYAEDRFLSSLHNRRFCSKGYEKYCDQ